MLIFPRNQVFSKLVNERIKGNRWLLVFHSTDTYVVKNVTPITPANWWREARIEIYSTFLFSVMHDDLWLMKPNEEKKTWRGKVLASHRWLYWRREERWMGSAFSNTEQMCCGHLPAWWKMGGGHFMLCSCEMCPSACWTSDCTRKKTIPYPQLVTSNVFFFFLVLWLGSLVVHLDGLVFLPPPSGMEDDSGIK